MKYHKDILEIIFYARGGQGAKSAAEMLAQAAMKEGKFVQAFPSFGPERSGAPTRTYLRISNREIRTHEPITDPDVVLVLDDTLLATENVAEGIDKNEALIIGTEKTEEELRKEFSCECRIYPVAANRISMEIIGQPRPNTVILGKLVQVTEVVKLESVLQEFRDIFEQKIGKEMTEKNILAIQKAYDTV